LININLILAIKYDKIPSLLVRAEGGGVDNEVVWHLFAKPPTRRYSGSMASWCPKHTKFPILTK
jgi:hypothetical protein